MVEQPEQGDRPPAPGQPWTPPGERPGFGPPPPPYTPPAAPPGPPQPYAPPPYAPPQQPYGHPPQPYGQPYPQQPPAGQVPLQGPEFMAVDRHNSVVVDGGGVAFEDHGVSVDFPWPEIRSVHYKASGNGKALMVAVIHVDGTFFECSVEARPRERLHQWFAHLAQVLGHYRPLG